MLCDERLWSHQISGLRSLAEISVADITQQSSLEEMAAAVLAKAPEHFCLAGFSLGSQIALEIMRTAAGRVERLALLSATHGGLLPTSAEGIRNALAPIEHGGFQQYLETVFPLYFTAQDAQDPALKQTFMDMAHAVGQEAGLRQMRALLAIPGPFTKLDHIRCPTVIIGGREDHRTTLAAHEVLAQEIPGSRLVVIDRSAHFTTLEQPAAVTEALRIWMAQ